MLKAPIYLAFLSVSLLYLKPINLLLFLPVVADYISIFVMLMLCLLAVPIYAYNYHLYRYRNQLLDLKRQENWGSKEEEANIIQTDLTTSRLKNRYTPKGYLFAIPALLSIGAVLAFPQANVSNLLTILLVSNLLVHALCFALHYFISHSPAKMYCQDKEINLLLNQEYRRYWSLAYLGTSLVQSFLLFGAISLQLQYIKDGAPFGLYQFWLLIIIVAILPILLFSYAYFHIQAKEKRLLKDIEPSSAFTESDNSYIFDGIWGFQYCNPNNPATLVNKPLGIGQTLNIGTAKGNRIYRLTKLFVPLLLIVLFAVMIFEDLYPPVMQIGDDGIVITRTLYPYSVSAEHIEKIQLIESPFPNENVFQKVVGTGSRRLLRGTFSIKNDPAGRLYLFRQNAPYIAFQLQGMESSILLFNYEKAEDTLTLWQKLQTGFPDKIAVNPQQSLSGASSQAEKRNYIMATEIDYSLPAGNGTLHAVLNLPEHAVEKVPVVLFIGGSGMSVKAGPAKLNLDIAAHLLEHQIATLRYDERGGAGSVSVFDAMNNEDKAVFEDFVGDVVLLLQKLKEDSRIGQIYIAGHSEGALVGTLAAQQVKIDGLISLAGSGREIDNVIMEQLHANPNNPKQLLETSQTIVDGLKAGVQTAEVPEILKTLFRPSVQPYLISWMKYNPSEELAKLTDTKILILQGDNDMQVSVTDAEKLHQAAGGKLLILKNMTHMLKDSDVPYSEIYRNPIKAAAYTKTYQDDSLPVNPQLLQEITLFINN